MGVGVGREHSPVFCVCYPSLQTLALFHDQTENSNFKLKSEEINALFQTNLGAN